MNSPHTGPSVEWIEWKHVHNKHGILIWQMSIPDSDWIPGGVHTVGGQDEKPKLTFEEFILGTLINPPRKF